jgi:ketol-acid reductoisomerase
MSDGSANKASPLDPKTVVAVIGYRGSAQTAAKNLLAAGHEVRVAVRPGGMSWVRAFEDGFRPVAIAEALPGAGIVVVAVPELEQSQLFASLISKHLEPGTLVLLEATAAAVAGAVPIPDSVDVACARLRATKPGETAASEGSEAVVIAVHRDVTGNATERTAAYARTAFKQGRLVTSNFAVEADIDVAGYAAEKGSSQALLSSWEEQGSLTGYEPDEARQRTLESLSAAVTGEGPLRLPPMPPSSRPVAGGAS